MKSTSVTIDASEVTILWHYTNLFIIIIIFNRGYTHLEHTTVWH